MILSHKHKFIFFCNMKTGSTSIEEALNCFQEGQQFNHGLRQFNKNKCVSKLYANKHITPAILKAWLPENVWNSYFKFVFVRNPWDWFVSQWKYHHSPKRKTISSLFYHPIDTLRYVKHYNKRKALSLKTKYTIEDVDYLFNLLHIFRGFPQSLSLYQFNYVFDINGNQIIDFIGKFEQLENDFHIIQSKLNLDIELPHLNSSKHKDYKSYFTEESMQRVAELWKQDIEAFRYSFE